MLLARASRGREVLAEELRTAGATVEQVVVYESRDVAHARPHRGRGPDLRGAIAWVTVTSSAIARSLAAMFGPNLKQARLASISPVTSETLRELGYEMAAEATEYTTDGLIDAILSGGPCRASRAHRRRDRAAAPFCNGANRQKLPAASRASHAVYSFE